MLKIIRVIYFQFSEIDCHGSDYSLNERGDKKKRAPTCVDARFGYGLLGVNIPRDLVRSRRWYF